jgi:hypothetical protein
MELWQVVLFWLAGCAGRFVIPYLITGLQLVGEANNWRAWPSWEWKLFTAFLLASGTFGGSLLFPAVRDTLMSMSIEAIILAGYVGQSIGRDLIKAIPQHRPS